MQITVIDFMSLDGVVQAPGGPEEDTDGDFAHGGWSQPYFDPEIMGAAIGETVGHHRRACCSAAARGRGWRRRGPPGRATPTRTS